MSKYDDIIDLPHHVSARRTPMSMENRAAQFAPFAALTGYNEVLAEAARPTASRRELSEDEKERLSRRLTEIIHRLPSQEVCSFLCFIPDKLKEGGEYVTVTGAVRRYDGCRGTLTLSDGRVVAIDTILSVAEEE